MNYYKEQQKEIETIKERTITLELSDADCERIAKKAGRHGLTVAKLLENFIGDLVCGTYTNGSDECYFAERWFNRCWFGAFPEETLLKYFFDFGYDMKDIEDFIYVCDEIKYYEANPEEYQEELAEAKEDGKNMIWCEEEYHDYMDDFINSHDEVDIDKEIELCRKWLNEFKNIKGEI